MAQQHQPKPAPVPPVIDIGQSHVSSLLEAINKQRKDKYPDMQPLTDQVFTVGNHQNITLHAMSPAEHNQHIIAGDYIVQPITGKDLAELNNMNPFDFDDLWKDFLKMCPDAKKIRINKPSFAMGFAAQVLFILGPESRTVKKPGQDKSWRLRFCVLSQDTEKVKIFMMVISTYKNGEPPRDAYKMVGNRMCVSVKQASLLALRSLERVYHDCHKVGQTILTPFAAAVFAKRDIDKLATVLNMQPGDVIIQINNSCQSGGHHLTTSDADFALAACCAATKNLRDEKLRNDILRKTAKQYNVVQKIVDRERFAKICAFATGGPHMLPENLLTAFNDSQLSALKKNRMLVENEMKTIRDNVGYKGPVIQPNNQDDQGDDGATGGAAGGGYGSESSGGEDESIDEELAKAQEAIEKLQVEKALEKTKRTAERKAAREAEKAADEDKELGEQTEQEPKN